jgi:DNA-directed RNA polymerase III subunit RPC7
MLSETEKRATKHFLLLRHQIHASPLYTSKRTLLLDPTAPRKMYGQEQRNALYGTKTKASLDPFTSMPAYSQRYAREERGLPDWLRRPICRELFPDELLDTVDATPAQAAAQDSNGPRKKRKLELSRVDALPSAEVAFGMVEDDAQLAEAEGDIFDEDGLLDTPAGGKSALEKLDALKDEEVEEGAEIDEEEAVEEEEEDEAYDDEDAGDYDAENYFDNGDEMGDDYGDGDGDGEGTY